MIDVETRKPLQVSAEGGSRPYIMLPLSQLDDLCQVLDKHQFHYAVEDDVISLDDGPEIAMVILNRGTDAHSLQEILEKAQ